ncbi:restriction endonuclease subunit S [Streptomyces luteolus]|uniref:Restriction endonuclease subunit S n=1 Tax=Streptomyces luteolus TaxID=3043615 RepID=A0ABT6TB64_9ACTN|nr:restriction endonuclease subunit S [Streptomyces sp. B-S-A12]MDI3424254.1 restriction endonuclease subunit S [Streptomyces sp. B-S-A12]
MSDWQQISLGDFQAPVRHKATIPIQGSRVPASDWQQISLGDLLTRVRRKVAVEDGVTHPAVSVQMYGRGLGEKEPFVGGVSKYTTLNMVREKDVVLRTITAFEAPAGVARAEHDRTHVSGVFITYEVDQRALPGLLGLYFQTPAFWDEMQNRASGTVLRRKTISDSSFRAIPFALPPLPTQKRIVEVISAIDDQITALDAEAGALTAVLRHRRADLITDDSNEAVRAEHAFDFSTGVRRTPDRATGPYMTPYLRSANVGYGTLDLSDVLEMNYDPAERKKFGLQYGDVVVSEGSASANAVGMPAMWRDELPAPVCTQMTLLRLRALEGVCIPEFVFHWSMWAYESRAFLDVAGGTNIKHISAKRAKGMAVRLPSLDRQREMVVELDAMESALKATRTEAALLRDTRARLLSGLLDRTINIESAELEV